MRTSRAGQQTGRVRRSRPIARLAGLAAMVGVTALALVACESSEMTASSVAPMTEQGTAVEGMPMMDEAAVTKVEREIIRTAYLSIRVVDVNDAVASLVKATEAQDGVIVTEDLSGQGDSLYANVTAQVPADRLDAYLETVKGLGTVDSVNVTAQDVTTQVVDLDARVAALQASIARLDELLAQATNVTDLIAIETERTTRQAELDSLLAQRKAIGEQVAMSTVTVSISALAGTAEWSPPGFIPGLQTGWSALLNLGSLLITVAGFLVPFTIVIAIVLAPLIWWLLRRRRRST